MLLFANRGGMMILPQGKEFCTVMHKSYPEDRNFAHLCQSGSVTKAVVCPKRQCEQSGSVTKAAV